MKLWGNILTYATLTLTLAANSAAAQSETAPQSVKAAETPWTVSCQPASDNTKVDCTLDKQLRTINPASLVAQINVLIIDGKLSMRVLAPHQLAIADGLGLQIDGKDIGRKPFTTSIPGGIVSLFPLDEDVLAEARSGQDLKFATRTRAGQDFSFSVSLSGFAAGLAKLLQ